MAATDKLFAGSIPEIYDRFLVPLIFESYARDLAQPGTAGGLGNGRGNRRPDTSDGVAATRASARRGNRSQSAYAQSCARAVARWSDHVATGRCACSAVRRSKVRPRSLPVRRDVLSRQGAGLSRGAPRAETGRPFLFQRVGPNL